MRKIRISVEIGDGELELFKDMLKPEPNVIGSQGGIVNKDIQDAVFQALDLIETALKKEEVDG